ncbi:pig-Q [Coemansia sp. RSA 552]|nr:pig-Q [Coemansia sp. RSA 552]
MESASFSGVFRIFWPVHLCQPLSESGYLVGWHLGHGVVVVAGKVSFANAAQVCEDLNEFHHRSCSKGTLRAPSIVGYLSREGEGLWEPEPRDRCELWIDAFTARTQVAFRGVLAFGVVVLGRAIVTLFGESIGQPWHFYAAAPINLDLSSRATLQEESPAVGEQDIRLQYILDHVNRAGRLYSHIHDSPLEHSGGVRSKPAAAALPGSEESCSGITSRACEMYLAFADRFLAVADVAVGGFKVKKFSAVGQQLDLVVRRNVHLIKQWQTRRYSKLALVRDSSGNSAQHNAQYADFWNNVWVIGLDILLGCLLGLYLTAYSRAVSDYMVAALKRHTVTSLEQTIVWLRGWPAGLKLNNGLDGFLAELFLWLVHFWTVVFLPFARYFRVVVTIAGWSGFVGGFTMQLAVLSDALTLATLHTYWFYMVATRIFHWQLMTLFSLFNLFRGRKHNVLRNRIDRCDYDLDQLLIGTILFTLLTYLFPTVLVYYLTFVGRRLAVIMAQGVLEIILGILNHCPIFYTALRLRDPLMFPGGVCYNINTALARRFIEAAWHLPGSPVRLSRDPIPLSARNRMNVTVVHMDSVPVSLAAVFFQYHQLWIQFSASYLSQHLLRSLVFGDVIRPVQRLQHTMIPGAR